MVWWDWEDPLSWHFPIAAVVVGCSMLLLCYMFVICYSLDATSNSTLWDGLVQRNRSLRDALGVGCIIPAPLPPPHCHEVNSSPVPHTPTVMMFCSSSWGQTAMGWTLWNHESNKSLLPCAVSVTYFVTRNIASILSVTKVYSTVTHLRSGCHLRKQQRFQGKVAV